VDSPVSEDRLWLVHLRRFGDTGEGDLARHLRAVLGGMLIADALEAGVSSIEAEITDDDWVLVGCDEDWLQLNLPEPAANRELFGKRVPLPGHPQRTRHELHLATAAKDVCIASSGSCEVIKGSPPPDDTRAAMSKYRYVVGYRLLDVVDTQDGTPGCRASPG
jgi:hypothetical protein